MLIPYLKLALIFVLMLCGIRYKLGLGLSALGGSLIMGLMFGIDPLRWLELALGIFTDRTIMTVWGVIVLVLSLSSLMERTGQAERFMGTLAHKIKSPIARMVFFPVLIGLLPMPGGAVFSAPMISAVAKGLDVPEEDKSLINCWFRHTSEMSWPLFPALILAAGMAGISTLQLVVWTCPLSLAFAAVGWWFFIRPLHVGTPPPMPAHGNWGDVLRQGAPIFVALIGALLFEFLLAVIVPDHPMDDGVLVALTLAVALCLRQNGLGISAFISTVCRPNVRSMLFMVGALGVFKNILADGGIVDALLATGTGAGTLWIVATILPVLIGALVGLMMASVGALFPLLVVLAQNMDSAAVIPWVVLGLASTLAGNMASPLHICFVLSCEYFNVSMTSSLRRLLLPCAAFWLCGVGYFLLIR